MKLITAAMVDYKPAEIYIIFSSPGGAISSGITLYNFLKSLPVKITMHNTGSVDSIANIIFLAAEQRYAAPNSSFLFHGAKMPVRAETSFSLNEIEELSSSLKIDQDKISGIICKHTKLKKTEVEKLFNRGESKGLDFATNKEIIHEIKEMTIPSGSILLNAF